MRDGFDDFVADRLDRLLRYATALACDPHLAQDIVQEVLLRAQHRWPKIAAMRAPEQYVRRMVTNEYLSWRRLRASRTLPSPQHTLDEYAPRVGDHAERLAERDAMRAKLAALPRKQRAALLLRYYEDCTDTQIADTLGCSVGTARSHISRALSTLRAAEVNSTLQREALA